MSRALGLSWFGLGGCVSGYLLPEEQVSVEVVEPPAADEPVEEPSDEPAEEPPVDVPPADDPYWKDLAWDGAADPTKCASGAAAIVGDDASYATIQGALDAVVPGERVSVCPGKWVGALVVRQGPVRIVGYGPETTVLSGGGVATALDTRAGELHVENLGIVDGLASVGGGILAGDHRLGVTDVSISHCQADEGGGIAVTGSGWLTISSSTLYANSAQRGGGLFLGGSEYLDVGVDINDSVFWQNRAVNGGAIAISNGEYAPVWTRRSRYVGNLALERGGAVDVGSWMGVTFTAVDSDFLENVAGTGGGAVNVGMQDDGWNELVAVECAFSNNSAPIGAAVLLDGLGLQQATLYDSVVDANVSEFGAAISVYGTTEVILAGGSELEVEGGSFTRNGGYEFGAIDVYGWWELEIEDVDFGVDSLANAPNDFWATGLWVTQFGPDASFDCEAGRCE